VASTDDVLEMRRKWADAGLYTRDEMQTNCCYALQDKTWVRDPDGNEWEAFVVLQDNLTETSNCCVAAAEEAEATAASCRTSAPAAEETAASCCGAQSTPQTITR
jgi:hypothetical protein